MVDFLFINQPRLNGIPTPREIDCSNPQKDFHLPPLGLMYLAGAVREAGKTAEIIDLSLLNKNYDYLKEELKKLNPKVVLGGLTTPTLNIDIELAKVVKEFNKNCFYGTYGPLSVSIKEELFNKHKEIDFILQNEPEMTIKELALNLEKENPFKDIKGIFYKREKELIDKGYRKILHNLDELPKPAFDLINHKDYSVPYLRKKPFAILRTSRGCPGKCSYCIDGGSLDIYRGYGNTWRAYSVERTLEEVEELVNKYGVKELWFFDNEFVINKKRVINICKEIVKKNLKFMWLCKSRVDNVDIEVLKWMKKAGCYGIGYGVESINPIIMEKCKKQIDKKQVETAVILTRAAGINVNLFFMLGLPGETEKSINDNIGFAKEMTLKYGVRAQCTIATPYPGTRLYEEAKENNWIKKDISELEQTTASISYPHLSLEQLERYHQKFYKEVVLNPRRLFKRILRIRNLNEIKNAFLHAKEFLPALIFKNSKYIR